MPTPKINAELAKRTIEAIEEKLREGCVPPGMGGGKSAVQAAADVGVSEGWLGSESSITARLRAIKAAYGLEPDWSLYRPRRYQQPVPLAVGRPAIAPEPQEPSGRAQRILVIGDLHNDPRQEHRVHVLTWAASSPTSTSFP